MLVIFIYYEEFAFIEKRTFEEYTEEFGYIPTFLFQGVALC